MTLFDFVVAVWSAAALFLLVRVKSPSPLYDLLATALSNLIPLIGVLFFEWQLFPVLFLFWLETILLIPITCARSHVGWFFGGIAAFFCLIHVLFMFTLTGPAAHIETTASLVDASPLLIWAVAALVFEHGYAFIHEGYRPEVDPVDEDDGTMQQTLRKLLGMGLIARVAALQVTLLLGLYLVDTFHSSVPSLLFFLFFKGLIDLFAWGFWLPAASPWGRLRKPMGIAMISTIAALPVWFPLGFFVLFSAASGVDSQEPALADPRPAPTLIQPAEPSDAQSLGDLRQAVQGGRLDDVRAILDRRPDAVHWRLNSEFGLTALHVASLRGRLEIVRLLIERGAEVGALSVDNGTPLHAAAMGGHAEVARLLLARGADAAAINDNSLTPADVARRRGHPDVARLLQDAAGPE